MALYSKNQYTGDGVIDTFNITFDYLNRNFITVYLNDVKTEEFEFITDLQIKFNTVPATGVDIVIARETPLTREVNFTNTSLLNSSTLDSDSIQMMHVVQEAYDLLTNILTIDPATGQFSAEGKRLTGLGEPINPADAVRLGDITAFLDRMEFLNTETEGHMNTAESYMNTALSARDVAITESDKATTEADRSEYWATEANVPEIAMLKAILFG